MVASDSAESDFVSAEAGAEAEGCPDAVPVRVRLPGCAAGCRMDVSFPCAQYDIVDRLNNTY